MMVGSTVKHRSLTIWKPTLSRETILWSLTTGANFWYVQVSQFWENQMIAISVKMLSFRELTVPKINHLLVFNRKLLKGFFFFFVLLALFTAHHKYCVCDCCMSRESTHRDFGNPSQWTISSLYLLVTAASLLFDMVTEDKDCCEMPSILCSQILEGSSDIWEYKSVAKQHSKAMLFQI